MGNKYSEQERIAKELEKRLSETGNDEASEVAKIASDALPQKSKHFVNFLVLQETVRDESADIMDSISAFFIDSDHISDIGYVKSRITVDKITLNNILFNLKTSEFALMKILEEIDDGNTHPRMFEALSVIQSRNLEFTKTLSQFVVVMETNYKNMKLDVEDKLGIDDSGTSGISTDGSGNRQFGTRNFLKSINDEVGEGEFKEDDFTRLAREKEQRQEDDDLDNKDTTDSFD
jgi:hypothetical protein